MGVDLAEFVQSLNRTAYPEAPSQIHLQLTEQMMNWVFERISLAPDAYILDLGAGQGPALQSFRKRGYGTMLGVNVLESDAEECRKAGFACLVCDMHDKAWTSSMPYDLVWARHILEHSPIPMYVLRLIYDALRPGGYLYLETPAPGTACGHTFNANHFSVLTSDGWLALCLKTGFKVIDGCDIKFATLAGPDQYDALLLQKEVK